MNEPCASSISESMLDSLRKKVEQRVSSGTMSPKRYNHTCEVEKMAVRLGEIFAQDSIGQLRAAALLHDITKELSFDTQIKLAAEYEIPLTELDLCAPKTLHAMTAAACIKSEFPEFADERIVSAVRWHTTGRAGMTLLEKLIYLADYIDMSRTFEDCVALRELFFSANFDSMSESERLAHLDDVLLVSFDMTVRGLIEKSAPISSDTIAARNEIAIRKIRNKK